MELATLNNTQVTPAVLRQLLASGNVALHAKDVGRNVLKVFFTGAAVYVTGTVAVRKLLEV